MSINSDSVVFVFLYPTDLIFHSCFIQRVTRLNFLIENDQPHWLYHFQHELQQHTYSLTCSHHSLTFLNTHTNIKWQRSSDIKRGQALAEMTIITVHLLSIPTQSEVMQKALSELTSCPLESSSSFFCWLQLSVDVWARCRLITLLSQMSPSSHQRGDVPSRCHSRMPCGVHTHQGCMLNVHFMVECHTLMYLSFSIPFSISTFQITIRVYGI